MASKRRIRRQQCGHKKKYEEAEAIKVAIRLRHVQGGVLDAYCCPNCSWWHVGHRPHKKQVSISSQRRYYASRGYDVPGKW